jgi:Ca-activated chloride channel homolog
VTVVGNCWRRGALAATLAVGLFQLPVCAQEFLKPGVTLRVETNLVTMYATVTDSKRHPLPGLESRQLSVFDSDQEQQIAFFRQEDTPVALTLVIDNSGSMGTKRAEVEAAVVAMLKICHPQDEVAVINFNDRKSLHESYEFIRDRAEIARRLVRTDSNGGTALRDALRVAVENAQRRAARSKRVVVIVTDGDDNASVTGLDQVVRLAQEAGVIIYSIGFYDSRINPLVLRHAARELKKMTTETGGKVYYPGRSHVLGVAEEIGREIRSQYVIGYYPKTQTSGDGRFHRITVKLANGIPATIRTRRGYYSNAGLDANAAGTSVER